MKTADLGLDKNYKLVFDSKSLSDWNTGLAWGALNNQHDGGPMREVQAYQAKNIVKPPSGPISIVGKKENVAGLKYTSGMIQTFGKFSFRYGYAEAQLKLPTGPISGVWPAFWMLAARKNADGSFPWPPEIDIMEYVGKEPDVVQFNRFYGDGDQDPIKVPLKDAQGVWHTFGCLWEPGKLTYFVDGVERGAHTDNIPDEPMYLLLNVAMTGDAGSWPGDVSAAKLPVQMDINYVRVWQKKTEAPSTPTTPEKTDSEAVKVLQDKVVRMGNTLSAIKKALESDGY